MKEKELKQAPASTFYDVRSRRMAAPSYTPVPVPKLFSHKAMVGATRQKYLQLPEVGTSIIYSACIWSLLIHNDVARWCQRNMKLEKVRDTKQIG